MKLLALFRTLRSAAFIALLGTVSAALAQSPPAGADYYNIPAELAGAPFYCTASATPKTYNCPSISLGKESVLVLTQDVTINISGSFSAGKELWTTNNGYALNVNVSGSAAIQKAFNVHMNLNAGGSISMAKDATLVGNVYAAGSISIDQNATITGNISAGGDIAIGNGGVIEGDVHAGGNLNVGGSTTIEGNCTYSSTNYTCQPPVASLHHIRLNHTGSGLTCTPSAVTVNACNGTDSNGTCTASTVGVGGNVIAVAGNGSTIATVPFTIPSGSSSVTVSVPVSTPQDVTFGVNGLTVTASNAMTCWNGAAANCSHTYADSDLRFNIPNHTSAQAQSVTIQALKKGSNTQTCVPGFTGARNIKFACSYNNPAVTNTTLAPTVNGASMSSTSAKCDATGRTLALTFDGTGTATATFAYADVGQVTVAATDVQTGITGDDSFVAAPASFTVNTSATTVAAGSPFAFQFTARNAAGNVTPAFGKEATPPTVNLSPVRCTPATVDGGVDGTSTGNPISYSNGVGTTGVLWAETGTANVKVDLPGGALNPGYLGSNLGATGTSTGCHLRSLPHHFDVQITQTRPYWYSDQPVTDIIIMAKEAGGGLTKNYPKGETGNVTLAAWTTAVPSTVVPGTTLTVAPGDVPVATFADGVATVQPKFKFVNDLTAPMAIRVRATGQHAVNSGNTGSDVGITVRRGRLRLSNAFGSASLNLQMKVQAEYWTGQSWLLNADDSTTDVPLTAIALTPSGPSGVVPTGSPITLVNGQGTLTLQKPTSGRGSVDVAINLGDTSTDLSCLSSHPSSTGASRIWLRSRNGSCAATYDRDPSARASFGLSTPESRATIHFREVFN
ncbi:polymer-forming cytoskeletal protein [Massilia endophytica]|uniref:polymer-forming cytoskeletal protein n=1 Tax=Massilia endophytica TaxID=2899220 RepID=UPI001E447BB4|nr:polymer-forming cytoskeletal protein [Massilia endophytica]UGQ48374.1 polymer-forming cytoskeletal protein [Massilia endophytica]